MGVMTETQTSIISPNASLPANPIHANQTPGSHGGADSRCRTDYEVENSAITPVGTMLPHTIASLYLGRHCWHTSLCLGLQE